MLSDNEQQQQKNPYHLSLPLRVNSQGPVNHLGRKTVSEKRYVLET